MTSMLPQQRDAAASTPGTSSRLSNFSLSGATSPASSGRLDPDAEAELLAAIAESDEALRSRRTTTAVQDEQEPKQQQQKQQERQSEDDDQGLI